MARLIDLDDERHCFISNDAEYDTWNIDPEAPEVDAVPVRHGKWIPYKAYLSKSRDSWVDEVRCSKCGYAFGEPDWKYCPECGARMDGESDE